MAYHYAPIPFTRPPGLDAPEPRHPVAIVGAGPIGLAMAIDLAQKGVPAVVLDDNNVVSVGSRAICWAKRSLEIFDRLGVADRMMDKGVTWTIGRLFHGHDEVFNFDLLPEAGHKYPAFINLQQYYVENYLIDRARDFPDLIHLRFQNNVVAHCDHGDHVTLDIETPEGKYTLEAEYYLACDGATSPTRKRMGLAFEGQTFEENFLIVDVELQDSPFGDPDKTERWFWFAPPFHNGQSALLHKQPDNIYRVDLQLGPEADPQEALKEENILPRLRAVFGDRHFRIDWHSVYRFRCARLDRFVHGRVIFLGDSAHVVSPFGARGGNGGVQDVDNLGWKLAAVLGGTSPPELLETYEAERTFGADENILNSSRTTNFMTPKTATEARFRDAVLALAHDHPFARRLINSGRLSVPCSLAGFDLQTASGGPVPAGFAMPDVPLKGGHWLIELAQGHFTLVGVGDVALPDIAGLRRIGIDQQGDYRCFTSVGKFAAWRYGAGRAVLLRPDGHVAASFDAPTVAAVTAALSRARGQTLKETGL